MNKKIISLLAAVVVSLPLCAQSELERVLESVEQNNLSLRAEAYAVEGRTYEARMGNSLEPLSASYSTVGESAGEIGAEGELEVSQAFDMPWLYAARSRMAETRAKQYETEYLALRQQILLEAKEVYLELCVLHELSALNKPRLAAAEHMAKLFATRYDTGDATLVDKNRTEFEYLLLREQLSAVDLRIIELRSRLADLNGGTEPECTYMMPPADVPMPLDRLLADWEEYAPDLTVLRLEHQSADNDVKVSRRQSWPKVEIGYKYEYGDGRNRNGLTAGLSIPIFSNRHNVKRAKAMEYAARTSAEAALAEQRNTVTELYMRTDYIGRMLGSFSTMPDAASYTDMLGRLLEAGQINIVDYYSELDTFFSTLETRMQTDLEYRIGLARLLVIYM